MTFMGQVFVSLCVQFPSFPLSIGSEITFPVPVHNVDVRYSCCLSIINTNLYCIHLEIMPYETCYRVSDTTDHKTNIAKVCSRPDTHLK